MRIVKRTLKAHDFRDVTETKPPRAPAAPAAPRPRPAAPGPAAQGPAQRTLDSADDRLVVMAPSVRAATASAASTFSAPLDDAATSARRTLAQSLCRDLGQPGTLLESPKGLSVSLRAAVGAGEIRMPHPILIPLPEGQVLPHTADVLVELENGALLVLDFVTTGTPMGALKALAYDALQMRRIDRSFAVLVIVRTSRPSVPQDQIEAIGHGFDHFFGIDEADTHSEAKFAALRSRITAWISAAGGA